MRQLLLKIFLFPIALFLSFIFLSGCEKNYNAIIDSSGIAPFISNPVFSLRKVYSDTMYNSQGLKKPDDLLTIRGIVSMKVLRQDGLDQVESVRFNLTDNQTSSIVTEGILVDNGIYPDKNAFDSVYTQLVEYQFTRVFVGRLTLSLWSVDKSGNQSNVMYIPLDILRRDNQRPVLSDLQMDSLVYVSNKDQFLQLRMKAIDADGQTDILKVFFNSYRPDGSPATGNPFALYDDGNEESNGDIVAGDGIYGLIIKLPANTAVGIYRFEFHAVDKSLDSSNVIIKNLVIADRVIVN